MTRWIYLPLDRSRAMKMTAKHIAKVAAVGLVIVVFVIPQFSDASEALEVLESVDLWLVIAAFVLELGVFSAMAVLIQVLIPKANRPSFGFSLGAMFTSAGVSRIVPGGRATTAAVNFRLFHNKGVPADDVTFALASETLGAGIVLTFLLWLSLLAAISTAGIYAIYAAAALIGLALMVAFIALEAGLFGGGDASSIYIAKTLGRIPGLDTERIQTFIDSLRDHLGALVRDRRQLLTVLGLATAGRLCDIATLWVALVAFGHKPGIVGLFVAYGLGAIVGMIPISPSGLGTVEATLISTLVAFGTPPAIATLGVLTYRLANFWFPLPAGAISYLALPRTKVVGDLGP